MAGLPMHHGAQLAVDTTLRSALTTPAFLFWRRRVNGAVLLRAREDKETKLAELRQVPLNGGRN